MEWIKRGVLCALLVIVTGFFSYAAADGKIYISQVQITGGTGHSGDDFIELFNPTPAPYNLNGHVLAKRTANAAADSPVYSWAADSFVPPYGFLLWANNGFTGIAVSPDATSSSTLSNDNSLVLRVGGLDSGAVIDSLSWGATNNGLSASSSTNPVAGKALLRQNLFASTSAYIVTASAPRNSSSTPVTPPSLDATSTPDTGATTTVGSLAGIPAYSPDVKISEVVPNPVGSDDGNEAIELVNTGTTTVDVTGWLIDDAADHVMKASSYRLPTTTIDARAFLTVVIPAGHFTLNNTGDTVNLYHPDGTLADSLAYNGSAGDGQGYQLVNGGWVWGPATLGAANAASAPPAGGSGPGGAAAVSINPPVVNYVHVSEFLPNPATAAAGPWVELYNAGTSKVSLSGWKLDNLSGSNLPTERAYALDSSFSINPKSYLAVSIPAGSFTFSAAGDGVRLFKPGGQLIERVDFKDAPQGQSYNLSASGAWVYGRPSPGAVNVTDEPLADVVISEVLANPGGEDEEFVEIWNLGTTTSVNLKNFRLAIGNREKLLDSATLATSSFYTLYEDDLPVRLRNSGQAIKLTDSFGRELGQVVYAKAAQGRAYAWSGSGYVWTEKPTPNEPNQFVLGAVIGEPVKPTTAEAASPVKKSAASNSSKTVRDLEREILELRQGMDNLRQQLALAQPGSQSLEENEKTLSVMPVASGPSTTRDFIANISLILSALALLAVIVKFFVLK